MWSELLIALAIHVYVYLSVISNSELSCSTTWNTSSKTKNRDGYHFCDSPRLWLRVSPDHSSGKESNG